MSPLSASVAAMAVPMFWLAAVFSATLRVVLVPSVNVGALLVAELVLPVPDGDQSLGVSPFSARTCSCTPWAVRSAIAVPCR